jgi:two-component system invasion response regulator UvrY
MFRVLIADDHPVVRRGLKLILLEGFPSAEVEEVADGEALIKKVIQSNWDLVISDLSMPRRSGLEALQQIKQIRPHIPVLILSIHPEEQYAIRVLRAGASGYLSKEVASSELVIAVKKVMLGKKYITDTIAEKLAAVLHQDPTKLSHELLSDREFAVLKLLASGKSVSEIAESMFLSVTTVSTYRARLLGKMKMKTNADLTLYAIENKLI